MGLPLHGDANEDPQLLQTQGRRRRALICQAPCRHIPLTAPDGRRKNSASLPHSHSFSRSAFQMLRVGAEAAGVPSPHCLLTCTPSPCWLLSQKPHGSQLQSRAGPVCLLLKPCRGCRLTENKACEGFEGTLRLPQSHPSAQTRTGLVKPQGCSLHALPQDIDTASPPLVPKIVCFRHLQDTEFQESSSGHVAIVQT